MAYLEERLRRIGVLRALEAEGFQPGDEVEIGGVTFELDPVAAERTARATASAGDEARRRADDDAVVVKLGSSVVADGRRRAARVDGARRGSATPLGPRCTARATRW